MPDIVAFCSVAGQIREATVECSGVGGLAAARGGRWRGLGRNMGGDVERTTGEGWWTGWRRGGTARRKRRRGDADREEGDVVGGEESIVA